MRDPLVAEVHERLLERRLRPAVRDPDRLLAAFADVDGVVERVRLADLQRLLLPVVELHRGGDTGRIESVLLGVAVADFGFLLEVGDRGNHRVDGGSVGVGLDRLRQLPGGLLVRAGGGREELAFLGDAKLANLRFVEPVEDLGRLLLPGLLLADVGLHPQGRTRDRACDDDECERGDERLVRLLHRRLSNAPACGLRPSRAKPAPLQCSGLPPPPVAGKARSSPMLRPAASARRGQSPLLSNAPACRLRPSRAKPAPLQCSGLPPPPVAGKARSSYLLFRVCHTSSPAKSRLKGSTSNAIRVMVCFWSAVRKR